MRGLGVVITLLACATLAHSQRFSFKHYTQESGLTNLSVNSINQDKTGFLWVATDNGLFRYNGRRFEHFGREDGLYRGDVTSLAVAPDGTVWAGTPSGVSYLSKGRFHRVRFKPEISVLSPGRLAAGPDNAVYASGASGLFKITPGAVDVDVQQYSAPETFGVTVDRHGTAWFGCGNELCELQGHAVTVIGAKLGLPRDRWDVIVSDRHGALWVRSIKHLYRLAEGASAFVEKDKGLPPAGTVTGEMKEDLVYGLTVPTNEGLAVPDGERWRIIGERNGLANDAVETTFRDREGSLWIGLGGSGVDRWVGEGEWQNWTKAEGLATNVLWGLDKDRKGRVWVGTNSGVSMIDPASGLIRTWGKRDGMTGQEVRTVTSDATGQIWIGTSPGGLSRLNPTTSSVRRYGPGDGFPLDRVRRVLIDHENTLWVLSQRGVYRSSNLLREPIRFTHQEVPQEIKGQVFANAVLDDDGCIWIASSNGLYQYGGIEMAPL